MTSSRAGRYSVVRATAALLFTLPFGAWPHGYAGKRIFPSTLAVDDPFVMDEFSLLASHIKEPGSNEVPPTVATAISAQYAARITPHLGILIGGEFRHLEPSGKNALSGFGNLEIGAKYQFLTSADHEAIISIGLQADVGGTGDRRVAAAPFSTFTPMLLFGKGMGDLPEPATYLRPLAVTGIFGAAIPTDARVIPQGAPIAGSLGNQAVRNPTVLQWGFAIQYSLPYLQSFVSDTIFEPPFDRITPLVEFAMETCLDAGCQGQTTGTVNPGLVWFGRYIQLGIEAQIPINDRSGHGVGVLALFHVFVDDVLDALFSRPPHEGIE